MLVIRLQRTGRRNAPTYRVVVAEHTMPVKGRSKETVGHYLPTREPVHLEVNEERISYWISHGAAPSNTVARLLAKNGMKGMEKFIDSYAKKKSKKVKEEAPEAPAPAANDASDDKKKDAPVEEAKKEKKPKEEPAAEEEKKEDEPKEEEKTEEKPVEEAKDDEEAKEEPKKEETASEEEKKEEEPKEDPAPSEEETPPDEGDNEKKE